MEGVAFALQRDPALQWALNGFRYTHVRHAQINIGAWHILGDIDLESTRNLPVAHRARYGSHLDGAEIDLHPGSEVPDRNAAHLQCLGVVIHVKYGVARTLQLKRDMPGISQKMLTQHLRELEQDGLVERRDFGEQPPRVEYRLTESGRALMPVLMAAREFSRDHAAG